MSLGSLVLELVGNVAKTQEDMGRVAQIVETNLKRADIAAMRTSKNISDVGAAAGSIRRVEGAEQAAKDIDKVGHSATGARREMLVLAHELATGNFKRAAGSVMVLGERMDWMGKIMSPTGLAVAAVAAVVGGMAYAFYSASKATDEFNNGIRETGGYAAITEKSFRQMADNIADSSHVSISAATEAGMALIRTGQFQVTSLHDTEVAMLNWMKVTGENAETASKAFGRMREDAAKWAEENNDHYHVVTGAQLAQMDSLEKLGDKQGAYDILLHAIFTRQGGDLEHVTTLWEKFINVVREAGAIEATAAPAYVVPRTPPQVAENDREMAHLTEIQQVADAKQKDYEQDVFHATQRDILFRKEFATRKMLRDQEVADKLRDDKLLNKSPAETANDVALIDERYKDKGAAGMARADLTAATKPLQDQITAEEKLLGTREKVLSQYYKDNLIGQKGYYDTSAVVIEAYNQRIASLYDQEIAIVEAAARKTGDAKTKKELETRANSLRDEEQQALITSGERLSALNVQQAMDAQKYADEVQKLNTELGKLDRTQGEQAGAAFDREHQGLKAQATQNGDSGALDTLSQARALTVAQSQMNDLKKQAQDIDETLAVKEKSLQLAVQTGAETTLGYDLKLSDARTQAAAQLDVLLQKMQAIAANSGMPQITLQAQQFGLQVQQLQTSSNVLGNTVQEVFTNGFAKMLDNTITRTKSLRQEFLDMANSIEQAISKIVATDLANQLFGTGSSGGSGSNIGFIGQLVGFAMGFLGNSSGDPSGIGLGTGNGSDPEDLTSSYTGRAGGGPTMSGSMYEVNERGPELLTVANKTFLMMGQQSGMVTPLSSGGGGGHVFNMNIAVPPGTTRQSASQQAQEIMRQANIATARNA